MKFATADRATAVKEFQKRKDWDYSRTGDYIRC